MKKGWKQKWRDLLLQHFELEDTSFLQKYLPKGCVLDGFEGKHYLGLVSMKMTDVRHKMLPDFVWFKSYHELNVRTYIVHDNKPGVLFLSLDVDSFISMLGARALYGLPYRYRSFQSESDAVECKKKDDLKFSCSYKTEQEASHRPKGSFAFWATERYFFANKYLGKSFIGTISHAPWKLANAEVKNHSLKILEEYPLGEQHPEVLFCEALHVSTSELRLL